jgi:hypothetical protein
MSESPESQPDRDDDQTSGPPQTEPRGNPEPDAEDVERSEEKLDEVSGN